MSEHAVSIAHLADMLFEGAPKQQGSFQLVFENHTTTSANEILFALLVLGIKRMYGDDIHVMNITKEQFDAVNRRIEVLSFTTKYEPIIEDDELKGYKVYFEPWRQLTTCSGRTLL